MCTALLSLRTISLLLTNTFLRGCSKSHFLTMPEGNGEEEWSGRRTRFMDCCLFYLKRKKTQPLPSSITCPQSATLAVCSKQGREEAMGSYGQWTSVRGNHFWWVWEWYCLSTGAKELKVLWCSRDCSLILIYHGGSAGRRGSSRTQPGSAGATRTCWPHTQWRSWGGGDRGDFFPFTCKSDHSDRHKDVGTLGPLRAASEQGDIGSCWDLNAG